MTARLSSGSKNSEPGARYVNPSFGLSIWGPLVPASDCRSCLYTLSGLQLVGGLLLWWLPGRNPGASRPLWMTRLIRTGGVLAGTYVMGMASLELIRLQLPVDPWAEDAQQARNKAIARGEKVSKWFGPSGYRAVEYKEWKKRVDASFAAAEVMNHRAIITSKIHADIRDNNREIANRILGELRQDNDPSVSETRALIDLKEEIDSGDDNNTISWDAYGPWESLCDETDILVRLMPHTRGVHEDSAVMQVNFNTDGDSSSDIEETSGKINSDSSEGTE